MVNKFVVFKKVYKSILIICSMKRGLIFSLLLILSLSLVSAGFFSNFWGKLTGNVVSQPTSLYVINSDSSSITWKWNSVSGATSY